MNRSKKRLRGEMVEPPHPLNWKPLVELAGKQAEDFMLMFDVELENGQRLTAFKHWWTRGYIHLARDGRVFVYEHPMQDLDKPGWYREVDPIQHLDRVLPHGSRLADYRELV
ncbi:MAG TPA: hypothetical protein VFT19_06655 [Solirubrobacterales bacterium]|nr:hypothetical protein [Solirubrobacterales bacterium]